MKRNAPKFNPKGFLAKVGEGRSIGNYSVDRLVALGDALDMAHVHEGGSGLGANDPGFVTMTDTFSGPKRTFKVGRCESWGTMQ